MQSITASPVCAASAGASLRTPFLNTQLVAASHFLPQNHNTRTLLSLSPATWTKPHQFPAIRRVQGPRAFSEPSNVGPLTKFVKNLQGSLPIVGLVSRLFSDEGGVGTDRIRYGEFCTRVEKGLSEDAQKAFAEFRSRHGKMARKQVVFLWCWAPAVGAGLVRSEELLVGARRMRFSNDTEYELDRLDMLMDESAKKRAKSKGTFAEIPMAARAQKALEAVCACCLGSTSYPAEDAPILAKIFGAVFSSVDPDEILRMVEMRVAAAVEEESPAAEDESETVISSE